MMSLCTVVIICEQKQFLWVLGLWSPFRRQNIWAGRSLRNHLTQLPHLMESKMRSRVAWWLMHSHSAGQCHGSRSTQLFWSSILSAAPCTVEWLQLSTVRKLLTQFPHIIRCQASFVFVTTAHVQTRGIRVYWSRKVPKIFISTARSLIRVGEEETYSDSAYSSYAMYFASLGLSFFTCNMKILTMMTLGPDLAWLCIGIIYSCYWASLWDPHFIAVAFSTEHVLTWLFSYLIWFYVSQKNNSYASFIQYSNDEMNSSANGSI